MPKVVVPNNPDAGPDKVAIETVEEKLEEASEEIDEAEEAGKVTPEWASHLALKLDEVKADITDLKAKQGTNPEVAQMEVRLGMMETILTEIKTRLDTPNSELTPEQESQNSEDQQKKKPKPAPKKAAAQPREKPKKNWL